MTYDMYLLHQVVLIHVDLWKQHETICQVFSEVKRLGGGQAAAKVVERWALGGEKATKFLKGWIMNHKSRRWKDWRLNLVMISQQQKMKLFFSFFFLSGMI